MNFLVTPSWQVLVLFGSVLLYGFLDLVDKRRIQDEREEWIRLKAADFQQRLNLIAVTAMSLYLYLSPGFSPYSCIQIFILSSLYGEVVGKLYYRFR